MILLLLHTLLPPLPSFTLCSTLAIRHDALWGCWCVAMGVGCLGIGTTVTLRDRMPCGGLQLLLLFSIAKALTLNGQALLAFKAVVVQDPTGVLANRDATVADPCAWNGIACSSSSIDATQPRGIVALSLPKKRLVAKRRSRPRCTTSTSAATASSAPSHPSSSLARPRSIASSSTGTRSMVSVCLYLSHPLNTLLA